MHTMASMRAAMAHRLRPVVVEVARRASCTTNTPSMVMAVSLQKKATETTVSAATSANQEEEEAPSSANAARERQAHSTSARPTMPGHAYTSEMQ